MRRALIASWLILTLSVSGTGCKKSCHDSPQNGAPSHQYVGNRC